ncbi:polyprenyl synthetase family protein [Brumimicrobium aurantiacum]|uniref:Polyprenyl synthetase family protein n=1 Tax=Brumimicrobium aurantiacum TaxID=1737063 RepID=A0A3E1F1C7_9FLAO|nr:polyprenyl synthetase family protein [Brumimicrobium aurantiacum]RFC55618.1 polyprenyl synthetase family protein [Brumimicrobium aurantiacum]
MVQLQEYQQLLEKKIAALELPKEPKNLYDPLRYFLTLGGKRTRPCLTMLGCNLFGTPGIKAINAALAVELFHNFTLIHDDIMDDAPLRRGQSTVHEKWDQDIAILSGDVLFVEAYSLLAKHDTDVLPKLLSVFTRTAREVCEGQQMDMDFETSNSITKEEYIEMIRLKTSVLLGAALEMGALIGGAENEEDISNIYNFGMNIGLAFQMHDDILDLYADPEKFGKQVGGDILSNKKTYLLLTALELAEGEQKKALLDLLENQDGETKIENAKTIFEELKVKEIAEEKKEEFYQRALENMSNINVSNEQKQPLLDLAKYLMSRDH